MDINSCACVQRFYVHETTVPINFCNFLVFLMSVKILHSKLGKLVESVVDLSMVKLLNVMTFH